MKLPYTHWDINTLIPEIYSSKFLLVTIPCYAEEEVMRTLKNLDEARLIGKKAYVLLLINSEEKADTNTIELNELAYSSAVEYPFSQIEILPIMVYDIPEKIAGVGLARRMAMDLAAEIYIHNGLNDSPIFCLDADSMVEANYFQEVDDFFKDNPEMAAASIHYEHPLDSCNDPVLLDGIMDYELHLRYFIQAQKWAGHPHAFQTVGSSMAVRAEAYKKQGGMNKRKAGEDFYFLHKFSKIGKLGEIKNTTVYPGIRISDRVPFGTGRALSEIAGGQKWNTYSSDFFFDLKKLIDAINGSYGQNPDEFISQCPESFKSFIQPINFREIYSQIGENSSSKTSYTQRFFQWFDAFQVFKYAHYYRDCVLPNRDVLTAVTEFFRKYKKVDLPFEKREALLWLRKRDRA